MKKPGRNVDFKIDDDKSSGANDLVFWQKALYFLLTFIVIISFTIIVIQQRQIKDLNKQHVTLQKAINELETKKNKLENQLNFDVGARFYASGFMGDGESGTNYVQLIEACKTKPHSPPYCIKTTYTPGPKKWAGIYWQNKPNNWGDKPGKNFQEAGYKKLTFRARGENGGEVVEFKAGDIDDSEKQFKDSFNVSNGKIILEKEWKQYTLNLDGLDLSSVIGGFCWVASRAANPDGLTFYLDDIYYDF
jgi:hypothetical protein